MAIAPFTKTPCLNLSSAAVNFWETGPRSPRSRVLFAENINAIHPDEITRETQNILTGAAAEADRASNVAVMSSGIESYRIGVDFPVQDEFQWQLVKALYMGGELPEVEAYSTILAMTQLREVNQIVIEQTQQLLRQKDGRMQADLIGRADEIISEIKRFAPQIQPLISWYEVERTRIPPGNIKNIAERTLKICNGLEHVLSLYLGTLSPQLRRSNENFALESLPDFE